MFAQPSLRHPDSTSSGKASDQLSVNARVSAFPRRRSPSPLKLFSSIKSPDVQETKETEQEQNKTRKRWTVDYLAELRKPSGARPMGARPPPGRTSTTSLDLPPRASSVLAIERLDENTPGQVEKLKRSISPFGSQRSRSALENRAQAGRPLAREPDINIMEDIARTNAKVDNVQVEIDGRRQSMPYYERGQRWMERHEAKSLRAAMQYMDLEEDKKVHAAAQEEAAELVWKHKYADKPYENPDTLKHAIKDHLRKGSHARSQSIGPFETLHVTKGGVKEGRRVPSDGSNSNKSDSSNKSSGSRIISISSKGSNDSKGSSNSSDSSDSSGSKRRGSLSFINPATKLFGSRRMSRRSRNSSGGKRSSLFNNPHDRIYEEETSVLQTKPGEQKDHGVLNPKSRNISGSYRQEEKPNDFLAKTSFITENKYSSIDIHKNPPSQSHDPKYMQNNATASPPDEEVNDEGLSMRDGKEIRSDDIRAATSMRMKDRSEKLPNPTYVSDSPGRPIVSFQSGYKPNDPVGRSNQEPGHPKSSVPSIKLPDQEIYSSPTPAIPSISLPEDSPKIAASPAVPVINVPDEYPRAQGRDVPAINVPGVPEEPASKPAPLRKLKGHWSPAAPRSSGALCNACGHYIQGRTLSAAGERFHPECFNCHSCGTNLEHVAFYPEPDGARAERLAAEGEMSTPGSLDTRFFCHLDFHEHFSPRCKSCKTPIEGEVVLACGAHWHQGHFFCAQCGDPFDGDKPFVEKDGWAWCVGCYKGRYSGKCRGCKKPVIEDGVMALGAEWHSDCFVCKECRGPFEDGRFFTRGEGEGPVCVRCEERRLKA